MHAYVDPRTGEKASLISDEMLEIITEHSEQINAAIV